MSDDLPQQLEAMAIELSDPGHWCRRPTARRRAALLREAAMEILELRRDLAVQWRDWDEVDRLDALLSAAGDTPDLYPNGDHR